MLTIYLNKTSTSQYELIILWWLKIFCSCITIILLNWVRKLPTVFWFQKYIQDRIFVNELFISFTLHLNNTYFKQPTSYRLLNFIFDTKLNWSIFLHNNSHKLTKTLNQTKKNVLTLHYCMIKTRQWCNPIPKNLTKIVITIINNINYKNTVSTWRIHCKLNPPFQSL